MALLVLIRPYEVNLWYLLKLSLLIQLYYFYNFVVLPKFEVTVHLPSYVLTNASQVQGIVEAKYAI